MYKEKTQIPFPFTYLGVGEWVQHWQYICIINLGTSPMCCTNPLGEKTTWLAWWIVEVPHFCFTPHFKFLPPNVQLNLPSLNPSLWIYPPLPLNLNLPPFTLSPTFIYPPALHFSPHLKIKISPTLDLYPPTVNFSDKVKVGGGTLKWSGGINLILEKFKARKVKVGDELNFTMDHFKIQCISPIYIIPCFTSSHPRSYY